MRVVKIQSQKDPVAFVVTDEAGEFVGEYQIAFGDDGRLSICSIRLGAPWPWSTDAGDMGFDLRSPQAVDRPVPGPIPKSR